MRLHEETYKALNELIRQKNFIIVTHMLGPMLQI